MGNFITSAQIDDWFRSSSRAAQGLLPHLVRRLIQATAPGTPCRIAVQDEVALPDYDGIVEAERAVRRLPAGRSVWEMGVGEDPADKFRRDYKKRTEEPKGIDPARTTFVFVTPHFWNKRREIENETRAAGPWKDVSIIDTVDLSEWLEACPAVGVWLAGEFGLPMSDLRSLTDFQGAINARAGTTVSDQTLIGGRLEAADTFRTWLTSGKSRIFVEDTTASAASAFVAGALSAIVGPEREAIDATLVFADTPSAVDTLYGVSPDSLIVIPTNAEAAQRLLQRASSSMRAVIPCEPGWSLREREAQIIKLPRIKRSAVVDALRANGESDDNAIRIARQAKGHLSVLLTLLAPTVGTPDRSALGSFGRKFAPLVLVKEFQPRQAADLAAVCEIAGCDKEILLDLATDSLYPKGPLVQSTAGFDFTAWEENWHRFRPVYSRDLVDRFIAVAVRVLGELDPTAAMPDGERFVANLRGIGHPYSPQFRRGLAASITQFAIAGRRIDQEFDGQEVADRIVRKIFTLEGRDPTIVWATIASFTPDLAEASPECFLAAVEEICKDRVLIKSVFTSPSMFGTSPHTYVLWALERLAWSRQYISATTTALAKLHSVDPGGNTSNRPLDSLVRIFLPWHPSTTANAAERISALQNLFLAVPDAAWELSSKLLPDSVGMAFDTNKPRWRRWAEHHVNEVLGGDYWLVVDEVIKLMLPAAGASASRWSEIFDRFSSLPQDFRDRILSALRSSLADGWSGEEKIALWSKLRGIIVHHREYADAKWALSEAELAPLDDISGLLAPTDPVPLSTWLFTSWPDLGDPGARTFEEKQAELVRRQDVAVKSILDAKGLGGLEELAARAEPHVVGIAGSRILDDDSARRFITESVLTSDDKGGPSLQAACAMTASKFHQHGDRWLRELIEGSAWDANARLKLLVSIRPNTGLLRLVKSLGEEEREKYWTSVMLRYVDAADLPTVIDEMIRVKRSLAVIHLVAMHSHQREGADLAGVITEALKALLESAALSEPPPGSQSFYGHLGYDLDRLFSLMEKRGLDQSELASLEWLWLGAIEQSERGPRSLQRQMLSDPSLFLQLMKAMYKRDSGEGDPAEESVPGVGMQGYRFLRTIRECPACKYVASAEPTRLARDGDIVLRTGEVDAAALHAWVTTAREGAIAIGRKDSADSSIGGLFAYSPIGRDEIWPAEAIRSEIEAAASESLEDGFSIGFRNRRGVHSVTPGGRQEDEIAARFEGYADSLQVAAPRTAKALRAIATSFRAEADQNRDREERDNLEG